MRASRSAAARPAGSAAETSGGALADRSSSDAAAGASPADPPPRPPRGAGAPPGRRRRGDGEAAELPAAVQRHEQLPDEVLAVGRLAPCLERGDRRLRDDPVQLRDREAPVDRDRAAEDAAGGDHRGISGPAGSGREGAVGPTPGRRAQPAGGRNQLHEAARRSTRLGEAGVGDAPADGRAGQARDHEARRSIRVQEDHAGPVRRHRRGHRVEGGAQRRAAARRPGVRVEERRERQEASRLAPETPGRDHERLREPSRRPLGQRLDQDQPDARALGCRQRLGLGGEALQGVAGAHPQRDHRGPIEHAVEGLGEARLHGPVRAVVERLHEGPHQLVGLLEGPPRVALAPSRRSRRANPALDDAQRACPARVPVEAARGQDGVEEGEAEGGRHLGGAELALDAGQDRLEGGQLARRVEVEQLFQQAAGLVGKREAAGDLLARHRVAVRRTRQLEVGGLRGRVAQLASPAPSVQAGRAAEGASGRPERVGRARGRGSPRGGRLPDHLLERKRPPARRAARGEALVDPRPKARRPEGRGGHRLERGIEMTQVRGPHDDVGQEAGERRRLDRDGPATEGQGGAGHPAAAPEEIHHDVVGGRGGLDPGGEQLGRQGGRQTGEDGERERLGGSARDVPGGHGRGFCQRRRSLPARCPAAHLRGADRPRAPRARPAPPRRPRPG